jgi:tRNA pseudouridine38-40 synthase
MPRTALIVAYNGQSFHGWQYQSEEIPTVQRDLTRALSIVADRDIVVHCAGRTDSGVHATKQVVHFDCAVRRPNKAWVMGVNAHLDDDVSVEWAGQVADDFDARKTAMARHYLYLVHNNPIRSALMPEYLTRERRVLDEKAMDEAAQSFVGEADFSSFRAANCQANSPMRNVLSVGVKRYNDIVAIDIKANAFLHHMVRNIAGTLLDVGSGGKPVTWVAELMSKKDRTLAGMTAAPNGLFLVDVDYPAVSGIPRSSRLPHFLQFIALSGVRSGDQRKD